ncbi:MAG: aldo/keto reductase [Chloroflexota bacterium]|nr:aldo/keto reductase [Chloroflexota bacterium]
MSNRSKLGLGGHSFIEPLGNDPPASFTEQCALVAACLDHGVHLLDTTYYQERVALGNVLHQIGRRDKAQIMAWNFFRQPEQEDDLVPFTPYEPHHLDTMLQELQTDRVDVLVVHVHADREKLGQELDLARGWMDSGAVGSVALGMVEAESLDDLPEGHPVSAVLAPYNAFNREAAVAFERARTMGFRCIALSPFIRGWKLDEIGGEKVHVPDVLLRWVVTQELVDNVIVSMRRTAWVDANLASERRGSLSAEEQEELQGWLTRVG